MREVISFAKGKARIFIWKRYRLIDDKKNKEREEKQNYLYIYIILDLDIQQFVLVRCCCGRVFVIIETTHTLPNITMTSSSGFIITRIFSVLI